jgi:hypothetical protein
MFCPVCKTEYREGFMRCSDCGAALVASLPVQPNLDPGSAEVLWTGVNFNTFTRIEAALQKAEIPYEDNGQSSLTSFLWMQQLYEIRTYKRDHDAAQRALDSVLHEPSPELESVADQEKEDERGNDDELPDEPPSPPVDDLIENFDPDDATSEVWSGEEVGMAKFLQDSLRANGIGCVIREAGLNKQRLCVTPTGECRAREIIREVLEASPPQ